MKSNRLLTPLLLAIAVALGSALGAQVVKASDHDDGTTDVKTQNTNLTDLYVFTESSQNPAVTDDNVIFILNCNPRSLPQQQYYFNTGAHYDVNVSRAGTSANNDDAYTTANAPSADVTFRFTFGEPDDDNQQAITLAAIRDGVTTTATTATARKTIGGTDQGAGTIMTTPHQFKDGGTSAPYTDNALENTVSVGGTPISVFAGLREDPFFFDVEQYFKVRASAARIKGGSAESQVVFRDPGVDFTEGYNVLSIVFRVPRSFLQNGQTDTTFDVWEAIQVRS